MKTITFVRQGAPDYLAYLPRICRVNLALPGSIMLEGCLYCRRQLARAAGHQEMLERLFEHMANLDCSGAESMRKGALGTTRAAESRGAVSFLCNPSINF